MTSTTCRVLCWRRAQRESSWQLMRATSDLAPTPERTMKRTRARRSPSCGRPSPSSDLITSSSAFVHTRSRCVASTCTPTASSGGRTSASTMSTRPSPTRWLWDPWSNAWPGRPTSSWLAPSEASWCAISSLQSPQGWAVSLTRLPSSTGSRYPRTGSRSRSRRSPACASRLTPQASSRWTARGNCASGPTVRLLLPRTLRSRQAAPQIPRSSSSRCPY